MTPAKNGFFPTRFWPKRRPLAFEGRMFSVAGQVVTLKRASRPAQCNTSCVPTRSPPGCARDYSAPDHQGGDVVYIKKRQVFVV